ncbi:MAG: DMT family transporter [Bacteroidota bacterium]
MIKYIFILLPMLVGMGVIIQTGANTQLRLHLGSPFLAALVSFATGTLFIFIVNLVVASDFKQFTWQNIQQTSWWMWTGGTIGTIFIISAIVIAPKIGPTQFFGLIIAAQLTFSVVVDHYGWLGFSQHSVNWQKIIGIILLFIGGYLIQSARK